MNYEDLLEKLEKISINLESYNDYPEAASNNAKAHDPAVSSFTIFLYFPFSIIIIVF